MLPLSFPEPDFSVRKQGDIPQIFDPIRKSWVRLTPEEWVRQNLIQLITQSLQIPAAYLSVEKEIQVGTLKKRFDLLVYNRRHLPWMLFECKSEVVELSEQTAAQLLSYHQVLQTHYLITCNGKNALGWYRDESGWLPLLQWPTLSEFDNTL
ncbi:MAG: type I restriction enzyme HsdR N-terminal domain-containing protein [Bacteroidetes bacterium]|nr:type I restriction enzyme HsdR N-terminal domain-containing protein [Bacteroidota bacterium]